MNPTKKYYKCPRCGSIAYTPNGNEAGTCILPIPLKQSGICGGKPVQITRTEYRRILKKLRKLSK